MICLGGFKQRAGSKHKYLSPYRRPKYLGSVKDSNKDGEIKEIACDVCGKTFSNMGNCNRHKMLHSGIQPYACRFCGKRFGRTDHLNLHERNCKMLKEACLQDKKVFLVDN